MINEMVTFLVIKRSNDTTMDTIFSPLNIYVPR